MQDSAIGTLLKLCPRATILRLEASIRRRDGHDRGVISIPVSYYAVYASGKVP